MSAAGDQRLHPHLVDALDGDTNDGGVNDHEALDAIAKRLADLGADATLEAPPAGLFAAIEAELTKERADADRAADGAAPAPVVELASRRPHRLLVVALGAAAAVVLVVAGVAVLRDHDTAPVTEQVALDGLPEFEGATGSATVVLEGDTRTVGVDLSDVEVPAGHHLELWLLDESVQQLVPLGRLSSDAPHDIPAEVDLGATPIVDVSLEPDDGNPAHSGVSIVRGTIETS